ncbi:hypothetical protein AR457_28640 [Streptomyces agglomeratus]|uniref:Uncharacterized protein n=1 Tax=Streptomyces agglomeratus TaxID=285458 RepID=A0A1E5PED3_9ACTN|nr:hypothetical protein [Streptomyces agglomeratus]OEJ27845.1 hypothetical protein AS594_28520 [Streptomyces agglomeratus]OEJ38095.1 hypothetical protein BGK70_08015 [Streptomyces agglomeratus]OEJ47522.1 hypothetical protein AR457_28640 [Streptomyces agglomeratus]OEJ50622.1 hypothetical protein BGK72_07490 [Streptomyces agglomeratus]OEJ57984.1 hypothetical protein BGM19_08360 [Streptomyces agglomeratus]
MNTVAEQHLAAPDVLKLALYLLPEWLRITLGALVLGLLLWDGVRRLRRLVTGRRIRSERPAE